MLKRPKRRLNFLAFVMALLGLLTLGQLVRIQVFAHNELLEEGL
jgi:cell division protein FtsI/penicillin-binding protein 2